MIIAPDFLYLPWPPPLDRSHETGEEVDGDDITQKKARIAGLISNTTTLSSRHPQSIPFLAGLGPFLGDDINDGTHNAFLAIHNKTLHEKPKLLAFVKDPQGQARNLADELPSNIKIEIAEVIEDVTVSYDSEQGHWVIWLPRRTRVPGQRNLSVEIKWYFSGSTYPYQQPSVLEEKSIVGISSMLQCTAKCSNFWNTTANK